VTDPALTPSPPSALSRPASVPAPELPARPLDHAEAKARPALAKGSPVRQERPIIANSPTTGVQRRARSEAQPTSGGRATMGGQSRPQGPRQIVVPEPVRASLRETVGEPPSHVTVHEGAAAAQQTDAVNAEAFTQHGQIYFAADAPVESERGQQLLAHELTHVMQQHGRGSSMPGENTDEGQQLEHAARRVEDHMVHGRSEPIRPVALDSKAGEPAPLHHRITPNGERSSAMGATSTQTPQSSAPSVQHQGSLAPAPSATDAGVQRSPREPTHAILDGIGKATSSALTKTRESLLGQLEQEFAGPPKSKKDPDSRAKRLERQAAELYPYLQRRLRAELVRDLERRGRLS